MAAVGLGGIAHAGNHPVDGNPADAGFPLLVFETRRIGHIPSVVHRRQGSLPLLPSLHRPIEAVKGPSAPFIRRFRALHAVS